MWPPTLTACECTEPGWCERHKCQKTPAWYLLCRRQEAYYQLWEQGQGPCLNLIAEQNQPPPDDPVDEDPSAPAGPGLLRRAMNFGKAVVRHVADGGAKVSDEVYEKRLSTCRQCDLCDKSRMVCAHSSCGCFLIIKARWQSESCPLQKWPSNPSEQTPQTRSE
jgi:hypothetical protein